MSWIKRILYGVLIGVASIAPGISGGTIAIALGFYESLINAVADLLKHFKKNFLYLLPYGIGALVSMADVYKRQEQWLPLRYAQQSPDRQFRLERSLYLFSGLK